MTEKLTSAVENGTEKKTSYKKYLAVGAAAIFAASVIFHEATKQDKKGAELNIPSAQAQPSRCASTWEMTGFGHENGDWIEGGMAEIGKDGEKQNPRDVISNWLISVDKDNSTLEYLAEAVHKSADNSAVDVDAGQLVTNEGCASDSAEGVNDYIKEKFASADISYGLAPASGKNSYVDEHNEIQKSAVPETRESIIIDFKNGNLLYVLGVCGNLVTTEGYSVTIVNQTIEEHVIIIKKKTIIVENKEKKHKLTSKSSISSDYKQPGASSERDSGTGLKPKSSITTSADITPPKVERSSDSSSKPNVSDSNSGTITD